MVSSYVKLVFIYNGKGDYVNQKNLLLGVPAALLALPVSLGALELDTSMLERFTIVEWGLLGLAILFIVLFVLIIRGMQAAKKSQVFPDKPEIPETTLPASEQSAAPAEEAPAEKAVEEPAPLAQTETAEAAQPPVESAEEAATAPVQAAPAKSVGRKKREPRADRGKINKDDLAEFAGMRILVAEDNMINQKVLKGIFAQSGVDLTIANDGQEALDILAQDSNYEMVLMDAHMPRVDGFEATRQIRANPAYEHIVVVALSGDTATDDIRKMTEAGMEEHLEKPIQMDMLYDVLYCYRKDEEVEAAEIAVVADDESHFESTYELLSEDGINIAGGDEELYAEILEEFVTMYGDSDTKLIDYISQGNVDEAGKLLLDITGVAGNIGATPLSDVAETLREAILGHEEGSYRAILENYKEHLQALLRDIKNVRK